MFTTMVAVTVLAIVLLVCSAFLGNSGNFDQGLWPVIAVTPLIALPLAFILAVALFIVVARRRSRDEADAAPSNGGRNRTSQSARARTPRAARPSRTR